MARYGLHFNKRYGQNFLIDENILEKIVDVADIGPADTVLEIGPGIGTLTQELAGRAKRVVTVEIDKKLIPVLKDTLSDRPNVEVINRDFLKLTESELAACFGSEAVKVVANLPYYVTTPIIMKLLESPLTLSGMTFLVQKEVGQRICAAPGKKIYGSLSIAAQYFADPVIAFDVPAAVFMPRPKVDSIVITLQKRGMPPYIPKDQTLFFALVRAAFLNRRKTLINSLSTNTSYDKETLLAAMETAGIDPGIRAEKLKGEDFSNLLNALLA